MDNGNGHGAFTGRGGYPVFYVVDTCPVHGLDTEYGKALAAANKANEKIEKEKI